MSKTVKQFRYYGENNELNQGVDTGDKLSKTGDINAVISNNIMQDIGRITHLGIQGLPGTKVYINNNKEPIIIGNVGIFELDLTDYSFIWSVQFAEESIRSINDNRNGYLIIDAIYNTEV